MSTRFNRSNNEHNGAQATLFWSSSFDYLRALAMQIWLSPFCHCRMSDRTRKYHNSTYHVINTTWIDGVIQAHTAVMVTKMRYDEVIQCVDICPVFRSVYICDWIRTPFSINEVYYYSSCRYQRQAFRGYRLFVRLKVVEKRVLVALTGDLSPDKCSFWSYLSRQVLR